MKKLIIALSILAFAGIVFTSCKSKQKCDAYRGSITAPHAGAQHNF